MIGNENHSITEKEMKTDGCVAQARIKFFHKEYERCQQDPPFPCYAEYD
jgi:hypothetical protein